MNRGGGHSPNLMEATVSCAWCPSMLPHTITLVLQSPPRPEKGGRERGGMEGEGISDIGKDEVSDGQQQQ